MHRAASIMSHIFFLHDFYVFLYCRLEADWTTLTEYTAYHDRVMPEPAK